MGVRTDGLVKAHEEFAAWLAGERSMPFGADGFEGRQTTYAGEREVKQALRKTLFKYRLHQDRELFDRAYGYIRQYYWRERRQPWRRMAADYGQRVEFTVEHGTAAANPSPGQTPRGGVP